ncbi:MAG: hypothetical protein EXQ77_02025 [Thermoleophilia bacterium]|nr:hypothetical protein [Thermoleophilia bacterium]
MLEGAGTSGENADTPVAEVDVAAVFAALRDEVRRSGHTARAPGEPGDWHTLRDEAERLWPVSADRALRLRPGWRGALTIPVKWVLRRFLRWYVEPVAYDQRSFNAAVLRLLDEQTERLARLEDVARGGGDGA